MTPPVPPESTARADQHLSRLNTANQRHIRQAVDLLGRHGDTLKVAVTIATGIADAAQIDLHSKQGFPIQLLAALYTEEAAQRTHQYAVPGQEDIVQLPELEPTPMGTYVTDVGDHQVEVMNPGQIDLNLGDGEAVNYDVDAAEQVAYALLAAVRCARDL